MENKWLITGLIVIVVLGMVSTFTFTGMHSWNKGKMSGWFDGQKNFGKHLFFGKTERPMMDVPENLKEELGLPEDATDEQVKDALIQKKEQEYDARSLTVKSKLGLPANASDEQLKEALMAWREENKDLLAFNMQRAGGFRGQ